MAVPWSRKLLSGCLTALACAAGLAQPPEGGIKLTPEQRAEAHWQAGYLLHTMGDYPRAVESFRSSIAARPTAEAHTFLGWSLSHLGRIDDAIAQCRMAIQIDPEFGNPYNDIGVYFMALGRSAEAMPWFEKAIAAKRYCCYQFPYFNLGRVLLEQGKLREALRSFERALEFDPYYLPALQALELMKQHGVKGL
ncbi:MAG: tetratricopeptide repeat protein [Betaproteobacteria bacterium]|nr:tetratricopeptide repeat protein [Betaproteobacteria bacterium]